MKGKKFWRLAGLRASLAFLGVVLIYLAIWLKAPAALKDELQHWPFEVISWAIACLVIGVVVTYIDSKLGVRLPKGREDQRNAKNL